MQFYEENWNLKEAPGFRENLSVAQYEPEQEELIRSGMENRSRLMRNFSYLIVCKKTLQAALVDPLLESFEENSLLLKDIARFKFKMTKILLTHTHWDHVTGLKIALSSFPESHLIVHQRDFHRIADSIQEFEKNRIHIVSNGLSDDPKNLNLGDLTLLAISTPGHSPGELCYFLSNTPENNSYLFSGDTLFIEDCGRTDFPDSSNEEMFVSLQRLKALPDSSILLPGHHYRPQVASFLGREKMKNPALRCNTLEELIALP